MLLTSLIVAALEFKFVLELKYLSLNPFFTKQVIVVMVPWDERQLSVPLENNY